MEILQAVLELCDRSKGRNLSGFPLSLAVSMLSTFSLAAWLVGEIKSSHREGRKQRGSIAGEQGGPASSVLTCSHLFSPWGRGSRGQGGEALLASIVGTGHMKHFFN